METKKVLLVYPRHSPFPHSVTTPLSIFALGAYLERAGWPVAYFDERIQPRRVLKQQLEEGPLLIGFSVMTSYQITRAMTIARRIRKEWPALPIVWGGIHPTMTTEQTLADPRVDFVVMGEGEETLLELCRTLGAGRRSFADIRGLAWKRDGAPVLNPWRAFLDQDGLPSPYEGEAARMLPLYLRRKDIRECIGVQTSRGCGFRCRFCYNRFFNKNTIRLKSLERVEAELTHLKAQGVESIMFIDDNLGFTRERLAGICKITKKLGLRWSSDLSLNFLSEDMVGRLEDSGCSYLFFGAESCEDRMLRYLNKGQTAEQIRRGVRLMARANIRPMYSLMIGFPVEEPSDVWTAVDFAEWIHGVDPRAEVAIQPYTPFAGTPLYDDALRAGFRPPPSLEAWSRFTMDSVCTPWVEDKALYANLFLISWLAFRYEKFLKGGPYWLLHKIALWRWRRRFFRLGFERTLFRAYKGFFRLLYRLTGF